MTNPENKTEANAEVHSAIVSSAKLISICTLLSRILGFVRDMLCTGFFGWVWDAFAFAFQIPNLFRRLFGEGALSSAFIPTFADYIQHKDRSELQRFINIVTTTLAIFLTLIALVIIGLTFFFPSLGSVLALVAPKLAASTQNPDFMPLFSKLLRIMIPYLPIICLVALLSGILNSFRHFAMPAMASVVLNVAWIAAFFIAPLFSQDPQNQVVIIAWAIVIGGLLELVMQIPPLVKRKITYRPEVDLKHPGLREILRLMGPATFGLAIFQINLVVDTVIALIFVPHDGAVSALYFGNRIMQFPLALIGISMAIAVFPYLAECVSRNCLGDMKQALGRSMRLTMFMALPASIGLVVLAQPLVDLAFNILPHTVFKVKGFTAQPVERTTIVLAFYALGIWAYCGLQIITRAFYAFKDTTTPVRVGVKMVIVNFILNLILVQFMQEGGIALATAITAIGNFVILFFLLQKRVGKWERSDFVGSFLASGMDSLLMGIGCYGLLFLLPSPTGSSDLGAGLVRLLVPLMGGVVLYLAIAALFRRPEVRKLWQELGFRRRHNPPPPPLQ